VDGDENPDTGLRLHRMAGEVQPADPDGWEIEWEEFEMESEPLPTGAGTEIFVEYPGAALTAHAFDRAMPGLGKWLVTLAAWLFALSTMISWSYYGEQGVVFLFGERLVLTYKFIYCMLIVVAALGFIETDAELDGLTALGTGVMLWANIPIMLIFGALAMRTYHNYFARLKRGELDGPHEPPKMTDIVEGKDHD
jgi:AGCS family alanine or glycine:cation symporter